MSKTRLWTLIAALVLAVGTLVAAGCGGGDETTGGGGGGGGGGGADLGLISDGKLLVGTDTPYPPFEIGQPPDISGYDIEVVNGVAKRLGLEVTYQDTSFDTIFRDVAQGKFDLAVAASTITPEREQTIDFSDPYYAADQSLVVLPGSDIKSVEDLDGKTVGAQDGTTGEAYANDETNAADVRGYPEGPDAINALKAQQVDAVVIDQPVAQDAINKEGGIEIAAIIPTGELYGLAIAQDNDALREAVNKALTEMKSDGTINKLYEKYFGFKPPKSVLEGKNQPQ